MKLSQEQIEGVLSLLLLGMNIDNQISLKEDDALHKLIDELGWQAEKPRDIFILTSISKLPSASDDREHYLKNRVKLFKTEEEKNWLLDKLLSFLKTDGLSEKESLFVSLIKKNL